MTPAAAQNLTLDEVLNRAATSHPEMRSAKVDVDVARIKLSKTRSSYGPSLKASASVQVWNNAIEMNLGEDLPPLPEPSNEYEALIAGFLNTGTVTIRDQVTWDAALTITQPLTPLWDIHLASKIMELDEAIAIKQTDATARRLTRDAVVAYWRLIQATKALEVAQASVQELESQARRLEALVELGAAQHVDQLRLEVALAAVKKTVYEAESNVSLAKASLAVALGNGDMPDITVESVDAGELTVPAAELNALIEEALNNREELQNLDRHLAQAGISVDLERANYYPDIVAMAQAKHAEGQGLSGENTVFVGAAMEWTFFEWGKTSKSVDVAEATSIKLQATREQARNQIGLQVRKAWFDYVAAQKGYDVAKAATIQADEAFRVETARFEAGQSTATDLLSAQTAVAEARNNRDAAYFQALVFRTELVWALGRPLTRQNLVEGSLK